MPATIDSYWKRRIEKVFGTAVANGHDPPKAASLAVSLKSHYKGLLANQGSIEELPKKPPAERWIRDCLAGLEGQNKADPNVFIRYTLFSWPESMESEAVPWEASRDLLDLQLHLRAPLTNRFALWYWRACLAMPDADVNERLIVALNLHVPRGEAESLQTYLAHAPWRSLEAKQAYEEAVEASLRFNPIVSGVPVGGLPLRKLTGEDAKAFREAMEENDG